MRDINICGKILIGYIPELLCTVTVGPAVRISAD